MKKILLPIIALLLLICSCHRRPVYPPQLLEADSLCSVQPDSAIALLEELKAENAQWDKATQMYYHLLTVKACDKAFITHTSDSLMHSVLQYYEHGGDKQLLPEAYYYMGSTYRDLNDAPRALEYYQKALEVMPEGASPLRRYVNNQMGWLFYRQKLYDEALSHYQQSFSNDSILGDKAEMASDLVNIGYIYRCKDDYTTSLEKYLHARDMVSNMEDVKTMDEINTQVASLLLKLGKSEEAKSTIQSPLSHVTHSTSNIYNIAADIYLDLGITDTATIYYKKLLEFRNVYGKQSAYEHLGIIASQRNDSENEAYYFTQFRQITDSIRTITATESIALMNSLYNYQKAVEERESIAKQNNINQRIIFLLSLLFIIIVSCGLIIYKRMILRREALQYKMDEIEQSQLLMREHAERSIVERNERIVDLESQLKIIGDASLELTKKLEEQQDMIHQQLIKEEENLIKRDDFNSKLRLSPIYSRIIFLINKKKSLSLRDFEQLKETFQSLSPDFMVHLMELVVFSDLELEITLLRRLGVSPKDIALLVDFSYSHISYVRRNLYKKATGNEGSPSQWDELVYAL